MVISQGEVWWADLPSPAGSGPGFRRPVAVVQGDALNRSRVSTVVCVPLTSNLRWADAPGNVQLAARSTGLSKDSVANVSQIVALDKTLLTERAGKLSSAKVELVLSGIDVILGRWANGAEHACRFRITGRRAGRALVTAAPPMARRCQFSGTRRSCLEHGERVILMV